MAAEVAGSVSERTLLDALFAGHAKLTDQVEDHMSEALPTIGSTEAAAEQLLAIAALAPAGSVHNVASGEPVTMRALMQRMLAEHGLDPAIVAEAPALSNRSGYDVPVIYADIGKTRALLQQWRNGAN